MMGGGQEQCGTAHDYHTVFVGRGTCASMPIHSTTSGDEEVECKLCHKRSGAPCRTQLRLMLICPMYQWMSSVSVTNGLPLNAQLRLMLICPMCEWMSSMSVTIRLPIMYFTSPPVAAHRPIHHQHSVCFYGGEGGVPLFPLIHPCNEQGKHCCHTSQHHNGKLHKRENIQIRLWWGRCCYPCFKAGRNRSLPLLHVLRQELCTHQVFRNFFLCTPNSLRCSRGCWLRQSICQVLGFRAERETCLKCLHSHICLHPSSTEVVGIDSLHGCTDDLKSFFIGLSPSIYIFGHLLCLCRWDGCGCYRGCCFFA